MTPRLLSVNVGLPREVEWHGKTVRSAIWKEPVSGPRKVGRINVEGDDQADRAGHGGEQRAVLRLPGRLVPLLGSGTWAAATSPTASSARTSPSKALPTTRCASATAIASARRRLRGHPAACHLLPGRHAHGRADACPRCLSSHHRPGFYFRVHRGGPRRGRRRDRRSSRRGPEEITVAEIDALLYLPGQHAPHPGDGRCGFPALSRGLAGLVPRAARALRHARRPPSPAWPGFRPTARGGASPARVSM